jgi:hypothetical protein
MNKERCWTFIPYVGERRAANEKSHYPHHGKASHGYYLHGIERAGIREDGYHVE